MRRRLVLIWLIIIATAARAESPLTEFVSAYREGAFAERVTVRLSDELGAVTQEVIVRGEGGRLVVLEFTGLRASVAADWLAVERVGDESRVYVAPVTTTPAAALAEHLPGVPAPQAALAFGEPERAGWPFSDPGAATRVEPAADGRLRRATVEVEGGGRVTLEVEPIDADASIQPVPVMERERVESVRDLLRPNGAGSGAIVRPGDDAPSLLLLGIDMRPWILASRDAGAVALVLCRRETPGASAGYGAALDVSEDEDAPLGYTAVLGVCVEPFDRPLLDHLRELRNRWGRRVKWTVAPETTIDRFAPEADAALIVIDALDTVRAVIDLDERGTDQSELAEEIRRALAAG